MPSLVSKKTQRIFIYLLATVGIIFLILLLTRQIREGFQAAPTTMIDEYRSTCNSRLQYTLQYCRQETIDGQQIYICEDESKAQDILKCDDSFEDTIIRDNAQYLSLQDSVCYQSVAHKLILCYNRPPLLGYDTNTNKPEYLNPGIPGITDPVPDELANQIPGICGNYQTSYAMVHYGISTISSHLLQYNGNISILSTVASTIKALSTQYCYNTINDEQKTICNSMSTGIVFFYSTLLNKTTSTLGGTLNGSYNKLINIKNNDLGKGYSGFGCAMPNI